MLGSLDRLLYLVEGAEAVLAEKREGAHEQAAHSMPPRSEKTALKAYTSQDWDMYVGDDKVTDNLEVSRWSAAHPEDGEAFRACARQRKEGNKFGRRPHLDEGRAKMLNELDFWGLEGEPEEEEMEEPNDEEGEVAVFPHNVTHRTAYGSTLLSEKESSFAYGAHCTVRQVKKHATYLPCLMFCSCSSISIASSRGSLCSSAHSYLRVLFTFHVLRYHSRFYCCYCWIDGGWGLRQKHRARAVSIDNESDSDASGAENRH